MSPGKLNSRILADRVAWINRMLEEVGKLPLDDYEHFILDSRNIWTAESCLRRSLEALLDLGRHILAKGFGKGITEHKEIARELKKEKVLDDMHAGLLELLAGYRNRLVHFYHEIETEELYKICKDDLHDIQNVRDAFLAWVKVNPDLIDKVM
jgi:uncharacterized protein YutE (UPF0331/DUF86 family)